MPKHKALHSRNKSSPALSTMANTGALKVAAKRAAFGDISQTHRGNRSLAESGLGQTENKPQEKKIATLMQPAQKPLSNISNSAIVPLVKTAHDSQVKHVITKRATTIFKDYSTLQQDSQQDKENQTRKSDSVAEVYGREKPAVENGEPKTALSEAIESHPRSHSQILTGLSNLQIPEPHSQQDVSVIPNAVEVSVSSNRELVPINKPSTLTMPSEVAEALSRITTMVETHKAMDHPPIQTVSVPDYIEPEIYIEDDDELNEDDGYVTARSSRSKPDNITDGSLILLMPKANRDVERELEAAAAVVGSFVVPADIEDEEWDISMVSDYKDEIFTYYRELEVSKLLDPPNQHF